MKLLNTVGLGLLLISAQSFAETKRSDHQVGQYTPRPIAERTQIIRPLPVNLTKILQWYKNGKRPKIRIRADIHTCPECIDIRTDKEKKAKAGKIYYQTEGLIYEPLDDRKDKENRLLGLDDILPHQFVGSFRFGRTADHLSRNPDAYDEKSTRFLLGQFISLFAAHVGEPNSTMEDKLISQLEAAKLSSQSQKIFNIVQELRRELGNARMHNRSLKRGDKSRIDVQAVVDRVRDKHARTIKENLTGVARLYAWSYDFYLAESKARNQKLPVTEQKDFSLADRISKTAWRKISRQDEVDFGDQYDSNWREIRMFENSLRGFEEAGGNQMNLTLDVGAGHVGPLALYLRLSLNAAGGKNIPIEIDTSAFQHRSTLTYIKKDLQLKNTILGYARYIDYIKSVLPKLPNTAVKAVIPEY